MGLYGIARGLYAGWAATDRGVPERAEIVLAVVSVYRPPRRVAPAVFLVLLLVLVLLVLDRVTGEAPT
jgi:hypothetical protein